MSYTNTPVMSGRQRGILVIWMAMMLWALIGKAVAADELEKGFATPPDAAKNQVWWHWLQGNVTREGITADLEAMKSVGVGGAQIFNLSEDLPAGPRQVHRGSQTHRRDEWPIRRG